MKHHPWLTGSTVPLVFLSLLWLLQFFLAPGKTLAQASPVPPTGLVAGDAVPDRALRQILQFPVSEARLSDFKDKLLILDFWATWCGPCITSLNKLDALQQQFPRQLLVLPVTYERAAKVAPFLQKRGWQLPSVTSDTTLKKLFPHQSIPHQVWIRNGKVLAISGGDYATAENIAAVLAGRDVTFRPKADIILDKDKPLLVNGNGGNGENLLFQSVLTTRLQADIGGTVWGDNRILDYNAQLPDLYYSAFSDKIPFAGRSNRVLLEVSDSLRHVILGESVTHTLTGNYAADKPFLDWLDANTYAYSLTLPMPQPKPVLHQLMQDDLNRYFGLRMGIRGALQRRQLKCLVLVRTTRRDLLRSKGGPARFTTGDTLLLQHKPFRILHDMLAAAYTHQPLPLLDETGYQGLVDLRLTAPLDDLPRLRQELQAYGLDLQEATRTLEVVVISETDSGTGKGSSEQPHNGTRTPRKNFFHRMFNN